MVHFDHIHPPLLPLTSVFCYRVFSYTVSHLKSLYEIGKLLHLRLGIPDMEKECGSIQYFSHSCDHTPGQLREQRFIFTQVWGRNLAVRALRQDPAHGSRRRFARSLVEQKVKNEEGWCCHDAFLCPLLYPQVIRRCPQHSRWASLSSSVWKHPQRQVQRSLLGDPKSSQVGVRDWSFLWLIQVHELNQHGFISGPLPYTVPWTHDSLSQ